MTQSLGGSQKTLRNPEPTAKAGSQSWRGGVFITLGDYA